MAVLDHLAHASSLLTGAIPSYDLYIVSSELVTLPPSLALHGTAALAMTCLAAVMADGAFGVRC